VILGRRAVPPLLAPALSRPVIAVTSGEPAGIGPDLCLALAGRDLGARAVVLADRGLLASRARALGVEAALVDHDPDRAPPPGALEVLHHPLDAPCVAGRLDPRNARYVLRLLDTAIDGCLAGRFAAMVTAPVHKGAINDAGIPFTGHTEYLAERARSEVVMLLAGGGLRVAVATTHLAVADVPKAIDRETIERCVRIIERDLRQRFGIARPRILVAGLNPHAGEGGHLGREEIEVIAPVLERLRADGLDVSGPLPADTLFTPQQLAGADCALAMFHDQGLPVLKYASFGKGVNITLGLPFVRTSVDHGTAIDLAGTGRADPGSLVEAFETAVAMAARDRARVAAQT
jgi:4-hydroxythreonine-4-phosphate dehydrogenase